MESAYGWMGRRGCLRGCEAWGLCGWDMGCVGIWMSRGAGQWPFHEMMAQNEMNTAIANEIEPGHLPPQAPVSVTYSFRPPPLPRFAGALPSSYSSSSSSSTAFRFRLAPPCSAAPATAADPPFFFSPRFALGGGTGASSSPGSPSSPPPPPSSPPSLAAASAGGGTCAFPF